MAHLPLTEDAAFLTLVHELIGFDDAAPGSSRGNPRSPYPCWQRMAPLVGNRPPSAVDFRDMRCFDISTSGLAFLSPAPIGDRKIVIALGSENPTYMAAEIVHQTAVTLVGCRFVERLQGEPG